jgi:hypothetical protein
MKRLLTVQKDGIVIIDLRANMNSLDQQDNSLLIMDYTGNAQLMN